MKQVYVKTRDEWRKWLSENHDKETSGIWLVFYKKGTHKPTLDYNEAVEEALCFGWIDSIIKRVDDERYVRKFTPRKPDSRWSALNKKRAAKVIKENRMTRHGLALIKAAKASGLWDQDNRPHISFEIPEALKKALRKNKKAKAFFDQLAPTDQKHFIGWIEVAKRQETIDKRVEESIKLLSQEKKLGLK